MGKYIKWLIFLFFLFVGLYFFGDFRLNDVNVRDYLHEKVTVARIVAWKDWVLRFVGKGQKHIKERTTKPVDISKKTATDAVQAPLDFISPKDKEELVKLLKANKDE